MKIATWNVNSLRVRFSQVVDWLEIHQPDVLALQETKLVDDSFPQEAFKEIGYHAAYSGQKTYNGVAILCRQAPKDILTDLPNLVDSQRRILGVTVDDIRLLNLYVPNGSEVGSKKYAYKLDWLGRIKDYLQEALVEYPKLIVLGDFNVAPADQDVHDPDIWHETILCSTPEREALKEILALGFQDSFRLFEQEAQSFSWWDYRGGAFRRNRGLRIDLILISKALVPKCTGCVIDKEPRRLTRPSDHAPVIATFA
ncbi:exodeoxyribonuclease III [Nitrosococcus oceani]|uniref:Exodeoxyribonuclease III n=1 Tax=Nitrosococcus oceani C-27 TaxID=314279 RepID=A0A0E2Z515_9GAMM|nr:exodeoxyribonuclease III [Nitrosococcus oceani]EDZ66637.1 exodeoxyribonuclease III [Nitrosococcus oceani AFC27]KFI20813.1 exodeoxyribonuclease III [Nitrosococcus oceani C-27]KFI23907.1 exodeoxyribonuclease III [Nitrosococcus oceani]GEM20496.1 exodeoxyribonuclease III [Nitrosococcus oceani]